MRKSALALCVGTAAALVTACAVGPDYHRPQFDTTANFKEAGDWKPSEPNDVLSRGPWWKIFNDDVLDGLEAQIDISNQNVKAAEAAFEQSRALVAQARAGFWPTIAASFGAQRQGGNGIATNAAGIPIGTTGRTQNTVTAGVSANWDIDIWGRIRRTTESNVASAQASSAALAAARLSAQAELATDYFELRAQDQLEKLLDDTVVAETQSLKITESRYKFGVAARADVVTAETQLLSSQAQQVNAKIQRAILEHAVAVLIGKQPAEFSLAGSAMRTDVPTVPAGVPSTLLERRPDVAEAERKMAAANAQIGVAKAGYFPDLTLSGSGSVLEQHVQPTRFAVPIASGQSDRAGGNVVRRRTGARAGARRARRLRRNRGQISANRAVRAFNRSRMKSSRCECSSNKA